MFRRANPAPEDSETTSVTDRERQLLLRACLSYVAPPTRVELFDLA